MKPFIILMMLCALTGCARHHAFPPDVTSAPEPVNAAAVMQEVGHV